MVLSTHRSRVAVGAILLAGIAPMSLVGAQVVDSVTADQVRRWSDRYVADFSPLLGWGVARGLQLVPGGDVRSWRALSQPVHVAGFDLARVDSLRFEQERNAEVAVAGHVNALATHFTAALADGVLLSTDPSRGKTSSWRQAVTFVAPIGLQPGDELPLVYRYRAGGRDGLQLRAGAR